MRLAKQLKRVAVDGVHSLFRLPPLEAALARRTQGRDIRHPIARMAPVNTDYPHPSHREVTREGINYRLDISDYQDWIVYWGLTTDRPTDVFPLIGRGQVVLDVGANLGDVALKAAERVGQDGRVFAFEPDPVSFAKLTDNLKRNQFANITAANIGLGEAAATLTMRVNSAGNRGGNVIGTKEGDEETFPIAIETLDGFVERQGLSRVDLIKVDVEGFEMSVFRGARQTLRRFRPRLFVEVVDSHLRRHGSSSADLVAFLRDSGYRIRQARGGELPPGCRLPPVFDAVCEPTLP